MERGLASTLFLAFLLGSFTPARESAPHATANPDTLVVIVGEPVELRGISSAALRRIFEGYPTNYGQGKRFVPLNQPPGSPARRRFDQVILGRSPEEVGRYWVDQRIRMGREPPRALPSLELAVRVVASLPGAITYVPVSELRPGVRALAVDGVRPGTDGYVFK